MTAVIFLSVVTSCTVAVFHSNSGTLSVVGMESCLIKTLLNAKYWKKMKNVFVKREGQLFLFLHFATRPAILTIAAVSG